MKRSLGELEVVEIGGDGGVEQLLLRIEAAELEVVDGELGAEAELDVGEIGGAGLGVGARLLDSAADLPPEIGLPECLALPERTCCRSDPWWRWASSSDVCWRETAGPAVSVG